MRLLFSLQYECFITLCKFLYIMIDLWKEFFMKYTVNVNCTINESFCGKTIVKKILIMTVLWYVFYCTVHIMKTDLEPIM